MKMWIYTTVSVLAFALVVSGQACSESAIRSRHEDCLNQFINNFYFPTITNSTESKTTCSEAKTAGVACVNSLLEDCSKQVPQLSPIISVTAVENAFQYVCNSKVSEVALSRRCYSTVNSTITACEETKRRELINQHNIGTDATTEQLLCLNLDSRSSCLTTGLQKQCPSDSVKFSAFLAMFYPVDCALGNSYTIIKDKEATQASTCSDNVVMTNFTECVKPFFVRIEKLNLDKEKCDESVKETLQCVQKVVAKCAQTESFTYIQKLIDLGRTKDALDFACKEDWGLAKGAFCYNKHYGSHIKPCLAKKMRTSGTLGNEERTFESVCKYIDATTDCARSGMETCKDEAATFSQYVRRFFPDDCTDDSGSPPTQQTVLGLVISLLFVNILLW